MDGFKLLAILTSMTVVAGCVLDEHDTIYYEITANQNGWTSDDTESETGSSSSTSETTGFDDLPDAGTEGETGLTTEAPTTTTGEGHDDLGVVLTASVDTLSRAGSVVLFAEVAGPAQALDLSIRSGDLTEHIIWPIGQESYEYIVDTSAKNGTLEFELVAQADGQDPADDAVEVAIDLPESGTLQARTIGQAATVAKALALRRGHGDMPDEVMIVGNSSNNEILISRFDGQLWTTTIDTPPDKRIEVRSAAAYEDGSIIIAGQNSDDDLEVRRYQMYGMEWMEMWGHTFDNAEGHDLKIGLDNRIYVAGAMNLLGHTDAAVWVLTESGGTVTHDTYEAKDELNQPANSSVHAVAFAEGQVVWVGEAHPDGQTFQTRAAVFQIVGSTLQLAHLQELDSSDESSGWRDVAVTKTGFSAVGWYRHEDFPDKQTVMLGRFGPDGTEYEWQLSPGRVANSAAWHSGQFLVWGGSSVQNATPFLSFQGDDWPVYVDEEVGEVHDMVVDRHGYTHIVGEVTVDGLARAVLLIANP